MKIKNYLEDVVEEQVVSILLGKDDICTCQQCRLDMITRALNHLPPKYVVSQRGHVHTKLDELSTQFQADIAREVVNAVDVISRRPRHK
ncbi:MAG: late competence development ComFB family protein [bacterium]